MSDEQFLQIQSVELQRLLDIAGDDPILVPQLRQRLAKTQEELQKLRREPGQLLPREPVVLPRCAIFLRGGGVLNSTGIRPSLAGESLIQYEKMFVAQAVHDEREAWKSLGRQRRPRGAQMPSIFFTGTPRGSFGLEFVPQSDEATVSVHASSLEHVADAIVKVASATNLEDVITQIPVAVLRPLKTFMKTLAQHGAELRLAFRDKSSRQLEAEQIQKAADRLEREVWQESRRIVGTFRGVTRETGYFDLKTEDDEVISGWVAESLTEDDIERIDKLTNERCVADIEITSVTSVSGSKESYVLFDATPLPKK